MASSVGGSELKLLTPVDAITITLLADNAVDMTVRSSAAIERSKPFDSRVDSNVHVSRDLPASLRAEHGFSALITIATGSRTRSLLFDVGSSPEGVTWNAKILSTSLQTVESIVLSHGHYDHTGGLERAMAEMPNAQTLHVHPHVWRRRRILNSAWNGREHSILSREVIEDAGLEIVERTGPSLVLGGHVLVTGEIDRVTSFEHGVVDQEAFIGGEWVADHETLDDQSLVIHVRDGGLVVITGCSHAGIVNILRQAAALVPGEPILAVVGGLHLNGVDVESVLRLVVDEFVAAAPEVVVCSHCTGASAFAELSYALPDRVSIGTVGAVIRL